MNVNINTIELDRLARYRAVCNGISFGQALVEVIELSQPRPAKDLRKDINLKTQQIMSTAGRLVDVKARMFMQKSPELTYAAAVKQILADEPDLKRAYAEGR